MAEKTATTSGVRYDKTLLPDFQKSKRLYSISSKFLLKFVPFISHILYEIINLKGIINIVEGIAIK
jgi:hypothetical protein